MGCKPCARTPAAGGSAVWFGAVAGGSPCPLPRDGASLRRVGPLRWKDASKTLHYAWHHRLGIIVSGDCARGGRGGGPPARPAMGCKPCARTPAAGGSAVWFGAVAGGSPCPLPRDGASLRRVGPLRWKDASKTLHYAWHHHSWHHRLAAAGRGLAAPHRSSALEGRKQDLAFCLALSFLGIIVLAFILYNAARLVACLRP